MADERLDLEKIRPAEEVTIIRPVTESRAGYADGGSYGYGYGYGEDDERVYVRRLWRVIRKRAWLVIIVALITTSVVTLEVFRSKSIYQAATTIEVGKDNRTLVRTGDVVVQSDESDDMYYVSTAMKTKIRQLESRPLLEDVVVNLKLDQNPKFLDVTTKKSFGEALRSIFSKFRGQEPQTSPPVVNATPMANAPAGGERSREESARLSPYVDVLASNLSAEPLADTRMLVISFQHTDPVVAADVVDNVAQVFIKRSFENKTEKYTNTSYWIERSTRELQARVEEAERELADYSGKHNIFSLDGKEDLSIQKLSRLSDQASRAETDRMLRQSLYEEVKQGRVAQLTEAYADPKILELQRKMGELSTLLSQLDVTYGPKYPKINEVKQQMATIEQQIIDSRKSLEEKLKADYERSVRDEASLKGALEQAKSEASQQNQDTIRFNILKQKVETAKSLYTDFLQKNNQAKIAVAEQHNNLKMIDPPQVPRIPVGPNRMRTILIGLFVSVMAGVCLVFFIEYLDNTVKTVEDVSRYAQLPALSVIPAISSRRSRLLKSGGNGKKKTVQLQVGGAQLNLDKLAALDSRSSVAEAYRVLRTSVLLSSIDKPPKIILVTSGQPGEGKTTTAVNTAISLAQLGSSVLIIDCDLRKPSMHKVLGIDNSNGLSTYLSRKVGMVDVMQSLPISNLWALPSGPIPPNPSEMLSSTKMKEMLASLSDTFDHIIIDSPPLLKVTDPVILSRLVDGVILVVHGGKSTRDILRRTRYDLSMAGAKIFGVVLNNVDVNSGDYDYYYDAGYGEEEVAQEKAAGASGD